MECINANTPYICYYIGGLTLNRVPHCKECKYFKIHKPSFSGLAMGKKNNWYECIYETHYPYITYIESKYIKTSPPWCHKRIKE